MMVQWFKNLAQNIGSDEIISTEGALGEGLPKKVAVLLDFVQITSTPPHPLIWTTFTTFLCRKIWGGVSPSLPIPKLTQFIQFVKSGQKIWAGPPPPHLDKIQKNSYFFS